MTWFEAARERLSLVFSVETLEYLRRGGRIGRAKAVMGGAAAHAPAADAGATGRWWRYGTVRGRGAVLPAFERFLCERLAGAIMPVSRSCMPAHRGPGRRAVRRCSLVSGRGASVDHVVELGAVVGTHGGPGTLGMARAPGRMSRTAFAGLPLAGAPPRPVRAPRPSHLGPAGAAATAGCARRWPP